jgi:predicted HAD superfamily phosphohydrolase YqeG
MRLFVPLSFSSFAKALASMALGFVLALGGAASHAQPAVGALFQNILPLGGGVSVPLPEGSWKAIYKTDVPDGATKWQVYVLKNLDPAPLVPLLVVRDYDGRHPWGASTCNTPSLIGNSILINTHGTSANQLINKCSRFFPRPKLEEFRNGSNTISERWWKDVMAGLTDIPILEKRNSLQGEFSVMNYNGRYIRYEAFLLPPAGLSSNQFRDNYKAGKISVEHQLLEGWANVLIEALQQSYFEKKPQTLMALNYKTDLSGGAMASVKTSPPMDQVAQKESDGARDARTQDILRDLEKAGPTVAANAPAKPAPSAPVQVAAAPPKPVSASTPIAAAPSGPSAQEREAKELKAQLDQMREMLTKLQAANAAANAAATAAANAAATAAANKPPQSAVTPAPKPAAAPVFANRKALIIGNDLYTDVPKLNNAGADADAMAKALEGVGFKVSKYLNLNEKAFKQALRDFRLNIQGGDEVLFFFAGHGVQLGAANYLLPTDIKGDHEEQVKDEGIQLQKVLDDLQEKKTKFALAVIDACRDNPFKGQGRAIGGRGLAPTSAATGQMIMFSAGSGQQALDKLGANDKDKNGLFTRIFLKEMTKPGVSVDRVLRNVRNEVVTLAKGVGHEQTPALYDQAVGEFFFVP